MGDPANAYGPRVHAPPETDLLLHSVHGWAGWTILALVAARLLLRVRRNGPGCGGGEADLPLRRCRIARIPLRVLIALPVTGTLTLCISRGFGPVHSLLAWSLLGLIGLYAAAATWHPFVLRDGGFSGIARIGTVEP